MSGQHLPQNSNLLDDARISTAGLGTAHLHALLVVERLGNRYQMVESLLGILKSQHSRMVPVQWESLVHIFSGPAKNYRMSLILSLGDPAATPRYVIPLELGIGFNFATPRGLRATQ